MFIEFKVEHKELLFQLKGSYISLYASLLLTDMHVWHISGHPDFILLGVQ